MSSGKQYRAVLPYDIADTHHIRRQWADYFDQQGVTYAFFSAANATALQQARREALHTADEALYREDSSDDENNGNVEEESEVEGEVSQPEPPPSDSEADAEHDETIYYSAEEDEPEDDRIKVLTVLELEDLFMRTAPKLPR